MDKNDFIKIVNLLIDKKLKEILPNIVKKEVQKYMKSGIEPNEDDVETGVKNILPHLSNNNPVIRDNKHMRPKQMEVKKWSKNPVIDKILNETAENFTGLPKDPAETVSYQQLLESEYGNIADEFTFNTKNMPSVLNHSMPVKKTTENALKQQVVMDGAPPEIANIMIKDYSSMLKKMDKVARNVRNGG